MIKYLVLVLTIYATLFSQELSSFNGKKRCSLISKKCIDVNEFQGKTFRFPENVTRFDKSGLTFCLPEQDSESENKPAAVIFIVDQSTSMPRGGDPNGVRDDAVKASIETLREHSGKNAVGYIDFSWDLASVYQRDIDYLSNQQHYQHLLDNIQAFDFRNNKPAGVGGTTNYEIAFIEAKRMLDAFDENGYSKYIIFITDGKPSESVTPDGEQIWFLEDLVESYNFPEMHTVFIGTPEHLATESNPENMRALSNASNPSGEYHEVGTTNATDLADTLVGLVSDFASRGVPSFDEVAMTKRSASGEVRMVKSLSFIVEDSLSYKANFENELGFDIGKNTIDVDIAFTGDVESNQSFSFEIEINDGEYNTRIDYTQWGLSCYDKSRFEFATIDGEATRSFLGDVDPLAARLITEDYQGNKADMHFKSISEADTLMFRVSNYLENGFSIYEKSVDYELATSQKYKNDETLQLNNVDTVIGYWVHPNDPRDVAIDTAYLYNENGLNLSMDPDDASTVTINANDLLSGESRILVTLTITDKAGEEEESTVVIPVFAESKGVYVASQNLYDTFLKYNNSTVVIVGEFTDSRGESILDTLVVPVSLSVKPDRAAFYDYDGDGEPDHIKLFFPVDLPADQAFTTADYFWSNDSDATELIMNDTYYNETELEFDLTTAMDSVSTVGYGYEGLTGSEKSPGKGAGRLTVSGLYKGAKFAHSTPLIDSVGPVVESAWLLNGEGVLKIFFSEPVYAVTNGDEYILRERGNSSPEIYGARNGETKAEWLLTIGESSEAIVPNDSIRIAWDRKDAEFTDGNGNNAHEENPWVRVQLDITGNTNINLGRLKQLIDYTDADVVNAAVEEYVTRREENESRDPERQLSNDEFAVYIIRDNGGIDYVHEIQKGGSSSNDDTSERKDYISWNGKSADEQLNAGPTFEVNVMIPSFYDALSQAVRDSLKDSNAELVSPQWKVTIDVVTNFYDVQGQFICLKKRTVVVDDARYFNELDQTRFRFEWQPETDGEKVYLTTTTGRQIQTGVVLSEVRYRAIAELLEPFYDFEKGYTLSSNGEQYIRFGYMRQEH